MKDNNQGKIGTCGCGRSPTGNCIGWHALTTEQYEKELQNYKEKILENKDDN